MACYVIARRHTSYLNQPDGIQIGVTVHNDPPTAVLSMMRGLLEQGTEARYLILECERCHDCDEIRAGRHAKVLREVEVPRVVLQIANAPNFN